jgi:hypothetical protein
MIWSRGLNADSPLILRKIHEGLENSFGWDWIFAGVKLNCCISNLPEFFCLACTTSGDHNRIIRRLEHEIHQNPRNPSLWKMLVEAYGTKADNKLWSSELQSIKDFRKTRMRCAFGRSTCAEWRFERSYSSISWATSARSLQSIRSEWVGKHALVGYYSTRLVDATSVIFNDGSRYYGNCAWIPTYPLCRPKARCHETLGPSATLYSLV